jgi:hypothetical protein
MKTKKVELVDCEVCGIQMTPNQLKDHRLTSHLNSKQHTPLPWKLNTTEGHGALGFRAFRADSLANAAYIVKAVNCHEALLEAVRRLTMYAEDRAMKTHLVLEYKELIARAEGKGK